MHAFLGSSPSKQAHLSDIGGKMQNAVIFDTIWRKFYPHYTARRKREHCSRNFSA
jgi:hypothetical protein